MNESGKFIQQTVTAQQDRIFRYVSCRVADSHDAEDICQEIFCIAIANIRNLRDRKKAVPWLFGIAGNVIKKYYLQKHRRQTGELTEIHSIDKNEDITEIRLILDKIPDKLKLVYELHYAKNRKIREMAKLLNIPEGTIKYYLFELRKIMKKELADVNGKEESV